MSVISHIKKFIKEKGLIQSGDVVIVALSGGVDSMVLFHILHTLQKTLHIQLKAVHVNHQIRIPDADSDEWFVSRVCKQYRTPLYIKRLSGFDLKSGEEALRNARYACFDSVLSENPGAKLTTAHHFNDQMETVIMRLMRGSSVKGLRGVPVKRGAYIRPLLQITRGEIETYAQKHQIEYRKDFTNNSLDKTRNRIRRQIVPALGEIFGEKMYGDFQHALSEINLFNDTMNLLSKNVFSSIVKREEGSLLVSCQDWQNLNDLLRRYFIEYCVYELSQLNYSFADNYIKDISRFIDQGRVGSDYQIDNRIHIVKNRQNIVFGFETNADEMEAYLSPNTEIGFGRNKLRLQEVQSRDFKFSEDRNLEFICGDRIAFPLKVRTWKSGDFFYPLGMKTRQKVSDFFVNQKIERQMKKRIPVIENNGEIIWLAGLRLDNRYRIESDCKHIFRLEQIKG